MPAGKHNLCPTVCAKQLHGGKTETACCSGTEREGEGGDNSNYQGNCMHMQR